MRFFQEVVKAKDEPRHGRIEDTVQHLLHGDHEGGFNRDIHAQVVQSKRGRNAQKTPEQAVGQKQ